MRWGTTAMPKRFAAITTGALALSCGMAQACEIAMPSCASASNGRVSTLYEEGPKDSASLFFEDDAAGDQPATLFLIECTSRKGVKIDLPDDADGWLPPNAVLDYLREATTSEKSYSLSQIRAGLRALGQDSRMTTLPAGHCGCELPKMEITGCGEYGP
ncbi:hypothetical protein [Neogemmobacter tilapiae]|uniref:Uncharacterized protein n=1 Tax=Neogemmobacter tilapiae TaxID=875041 RepID=A0A918TQ29_9RHOB|nr:hypothetical protein [Gemmobacter tilapiae]GHC58279.1 hypothetical protein GCM10007315_22360 [Gemmobacter tilapiae]